jgi:hypothetical protein
MLTMASFCENRLFLQQCDSEKNLLSAYEIPQFVVISKSNFNSSLAVSELSEIQVTDSFTSR